MQENYRPIGHLNIDTKTFIKMLANQIWQYINSILYRDQVGFCQGMHSLISRNKENKKQKSYDYFNRQKKDLTKSNIHS